MGAAGVPALGEPADLARHRLLRFELPPKTTANGGFGSCGRVRAFSPFRAKTPMAKPLVLTFGNADLSCTPVRVDRSKIYGQRRRVALDAAGRLCTRAALTEDGTTVIAAGMAAQGYFTPEGRWVPRSELVGLSPEGQPVDVQPSTLGVPQAVEGPVDPAEVLALSLESVFQLTPADPVHPLVTALQAGQVFRCPFNYAAGLATETAYLVANAEGLFALVGTPLTLPWAEEGTTFVPEAQPDEDAGDLDFDAL